MLAWVLAVIVILVAALLAFGIAALLHLSGVGYTVFVIVLLLIGIAAAITILVFHYRAKKERELQGDSGAAGGAGDLDLLLNDANRKLRTSQQGAKTLDALPLIYLLGDAGAAKTTTVVQSGIDPELLAGSASQSAEQTPTPVLNLWFARQAAFLEVGAALRDNKSLFERLVHRTRAKAYRSAFGTGAAPRAVIVCLSMDQLLVADGGTSLMTSARSTGAQLRELSRLLGLPIPVYVIVTKLDRVPHFDKYAHNLSEDEVRQILGSPLSRSDATVGTYADQASRTLASLIDGIVYKLGEFRVEMLDRENDVRNSPGVYEFPREFGKVRKGLNQYLVELCKPSQLSANPYLRGVYFTGVRARVIERAANAPGAGERLAAQEVDAGATQFLNISRGQGGLAARSAAPPVMTSTRVPQWSFLPRLLPEIILGDKSALSSSRQSAPARLFRRILFGTLACLLALYCFFLVASYANNAAIKHRIESAARVLPKVTENAVSLPSLSDLRALDNLRQTIVQLDDFEKNGAPWRYRFGLYQGQKLNVQARRIYFDRFRPMLLNPAQTSMLSLMRILPDAPPATAANDSSSYNSAYNPLKAYLITTSNPEKSQPAFQTPVLVKSWIGSGQVDDEQKQLAGKQFDFYGAELLRHPPYDIASDTVVVEHARSYLSHFLASTRVYQAMLADADKASLPIDFNRQYPGSANFVVDSHVVRGAFTKDGFAAMQEALKHPERYANGEKWVLGDGSGTFSNATAGSADNSSLYTADFLKEWREFLVSAHLTNCGSLQEAPGRLTVLGGGSSPLLQWFYVISHNTAVANQEITSTFQPAHKFVDSEAKGSLIGEANKSYFEALLQLAQQVEIGAKNPAVTTDATAFAPISQALVTASGVADQAGLTFDPDQLTHTTNTFLVLLKAPIQCVSRFEPSPGAAGNGGGQKICAAITPLLGRFPFNPNTSAPQAALREVDGVFAPETGALASTYNTVLNKILVPNGAQYGPAPSAPGRVKPKFLNYFNRAEHISSALYAGGAKSATLNFSLRFIPTSGVSNATIVVDGQRTSGSSPQQFTWTGSTAQKASLLYENNEVPFQGTWSAFQLVRAATQITRTSGGFRLEYPLNNATTFAGRQIVGSGKMVTFELTGPGAEFLAGDGLSGLTCAAPVILK